MAPFATNWVLILVEGMYQTNTGKYQFAGLMSLLPVKMHTTRIRFLDFKEQPKKEDGFQHKRVKVCNINECSSKLLAIIILLGQMPMLI